MGKIVLSYRRDDAKTITNWLHEKLVERYGRDAIFRDIDSIQPTETFRKRIGRALKDCEFVIAVIGPSWAGASVDGPARIHASNDWVRIEIETALQLDIPLLPVLVEDARMPDPETLPAGLREITEINALPLASGGARFHEDLGRLFASIDKVVAFSPEPAEPPAMAAEATPHLSGSSPPPGRARAHPEPAPTAPPRTALPPERGAVASPPSGQGNTDRTDAQATGLRNAFPKPEPDRPRGVDALFKWPFAGAYLLIPTVIAGIWYFLAARVMGGGVGPPLIGFACVMLCLGVVMKRQGRLGSPAAAMAGAIVSLAAGLVGVADGGGVVTLLLAILAGTPLTLIAWAATPAPAPATG